MFKEKPRTYRNTSNLSKKEEKKSCIDGTVNVNQTFLGPWLSV